MLRSPWVLGCSRREDNVRVGYLTAAVFGPNVGLNCYLISHFSDVRKRCPLPACRPSAKTNRAIPPFCNRALFVLPYKAMLTFPNGAKLVFPNKAIIVFRSKSSQIGSQISIHK